MSLLLRFISLLSSKVSWRDRFSASFKVAPPTAFAANFASEYVDTRFTPFKLLLLTSSDAKYEWYGSRVPIPKPLSPCATFSHAEASVEI